VARRHVGQAGDGTAVNAGGHLLLLTPPTGHGASHDVAGGRVLNPGRRAGPMSPLARERESPRTDGASRCSPCARVGSVDAGGDKVRTVCPVQETGVQYPGGARALSPSPSHGRHRCVSPPATETYSLRSHSLFRFNTTFV
jgi:hypothetical protein